MKTILCLLLLATAFSPGISAQGKSEPVDTTKYFSFYLNYWFNMHHFLWMEAYLNTKADSTLLKLKFSKGDNAKFDAAAKYPCACVFSTRTADLFAVELLRPERQPVDPALIL